MGSARRAHPEAEALVESLTHEADGVARLNGKAVFIHGALPGERVRFRHFRSRRRYDRGETTAVLQPSPDRVAPRCAHFGRCGGCSLQHLQAEAQLRAKEQVLRDNLERIGRVAPERWLPALTGPHWAYRRRARLGVRRVDQKGVLVGFRERARSFLAELDHCHVLAAPVGDMIPALRAVIGELSRPDRIPQIEVAVADNATALVVRHLEPLTVADTARLSAFAEALAIQLWLQPGAPETAHPLWPAAPEALEYGLPEFNLRMQFRPTDFVQINSALNQRMLGQALALLAPAPGERVLDLFCGLGNFSLPLARSGARVLGIEGHEGLVQRARDNARRNGIEDIEFRAADLHREGGADPWGDAAFDHWLLDPPRAGAIEVIKRLPPEGRGPRRILYVSCNPGTLARDAQVLCQVKGYRLRAAGVLDMFPQTSHVEAMALFERATVAA